MYFIRENPCSSVAKNELTLNEKSQIGNKTV